MCAEDKGERGKGGISVPAPVCWRCAGPASDTAEAAVGAGRADAGGARQAWSRGREAKTQAGVLEAEGTEGRGECEGGTGKAAAAALAIAATQAAGEAAAGGAAVEGSAGAAVEGGTKTEAVASGTHAGCSKEAVATEAAADSSSSGTQWGLPARGFGPGKGKEFLLRRRACSAADDKVGRRWEGRGARCLLRVALARHGDTLVAFSG